MDCYLPNKNVLYEARIAGWIAIRRITLILTGENRIFLKFLISTSAVARYLGRVDTYRAVTDRCKHCGSLHFHVPTFFQATGQSMIKKI